MEEDLLTRLGLCIDPTAPECSGIAEKVLRSVNPEHAKNEKDKRSREAKLRKIGSSLKPLSSAKPDQTLIAFSSAPSGPLIEIDRKLLEQFGEKFIRGITYAIDGSYIEDDYDITVSHIVVPIDEFDTLAKQHCELHERGPGLVFFMGRATDDLNSKMFLIRIFGSLVLRAIVLPKEYAEKADARIEKERQNQSH